MPRTTDENVGGVTEVDDTISLTPFILSANLLVTELCTASDYSDERLELIERWLSAHFYRIRDPARTAEKVGPIGENYLTQIGLHLNQTREGQMAMMMDTAGNLARLQLDMSKPRKTVRTMWLGQEKDEAAVPETEDDE